MTNAVVIAVAGSDRKVWRPALKALLDRSLPVVALLCLAIFSTSVSADATSPQKVLVLHSYHQGYLWTDMIQDGFSRTLLEQLPGTEVYVEYMNTKRQAAEVMFPHLVKIYRQLYENVKLDAIVASDNNALDFLLQYRDTLFPGVPVVFCGINNFLSYQFYPGSNYTGVREDLDIVSTINIALRLHPGTSKIALITDSTETGQINLGLARDVAHNFPAIAFIELNDLTALQLSDSLKQLSDDTVVLALAFFRDSAGRNFSARESMDFIVSASPRPVYTVWDFYMAPGAIGGKLLSGRLQGESAAVLTGRILRGEKADSLPVVESPTGYIFDYAGLDRFGISESLLPAGSVVMGRPDTFYSGYKYYLWFGAVLFTAQLVLIIALFWNISRRRRGEAARQCAVNALSETNRMFSQFLLHSPVHVFINEIKPAGSHVLMVSDNFRDMVGIADSEIIGKTMRELFPAEFADKMDAADLSVVSTGKPLGAEEHFNGRSFTSIRFPLIQGDRKLVAGYYIDITERKQQEEKNRRIMAENETILNNVLVGIVYLKQRRIVSCNRRFEEIFQYLPGELLGESSLRLYDSRETFEQVGVEAYATVAERKNFTAETRLRHKDGSLFWGALSGRAIDPSRPQEGSIWIFSDVSERKRAEMALYERERYQRALFDNFPFLVWLKDRDSRFLAVNQAFAEACGQASANLLVGKTDLDVWPQELAEAYRADDRMVLESGRARSVEEHIEVDGQWVWFETYKSPITVDGRVTGTVGFSRDITERKRAQEKLQLAASVFTHAREGIMITATDGTIIDVNDTFSAITGFSREEVLGQNTRILSSGRQEKAFYALLWRDLTETGHWNGEIWNRRKNGEVYAEMLTISAVRDSRGKTQQYVALFSDITALKEHALQLEHLVHYDGLTTLPNRTLLADRLQQAMAQAQRRRQPLAVAYIDLDGFKAINDRHGHDAGDQLLITLASRMKQSLREGDTLARLGGDEFVAVLLDLAVVETSTRLLARLLQAAAEPVLVDDHVLQVSASLGITFYPQMGEVDADLLLRQADFAMYQAKLAGKNCYHVFDAEQDHSVRGRHESLDHIRRALSEREFVLYYQPKVNMRTGRVIGVEALIRWQHPEKGLLLPAVFLPVIEDHALAVDVGEWVIDTALTQIERWREAGLDIPVSVNVGARQLQQPNFVKRLRAILAAHPDVSPGDLELEVLETSALVDLARVSGIIEACREIGVMFALDDFGTGYSSLTYLKHLPVKLLKIDQSFVRDMLDNPDDLAILAGVLGLAVAFRRQVIAEGVETVEHGKMLLQLGCELAQGYGIARPMPALDIQGWASAWRPDCAWSNRSAINRDDLPLLFAGAEHRAWIVSIARYLKGKRVNPMPLDHYLCRFGAWLDAEGQTRYGQHCAFQGMLSLHRQVHALAGDLCELRSMGRNLEALARLCELDSLRDALIEQLQALLESRQ